MSSNPFMRNPRKALRLVLFALFLSLAMGASALYANAQDFTLTIPNGLRTPAIDPGGTATATLDLQPVGSGGGAVSLSCTVPSGASTVTCLISPASATPPATPALTITTTTSTPTGIYQFTITGTDSSGTQSLNVTLSVTNLTEDYTLSVSPTTATPNPIHAGTSATTNVTITPIGSYSGNVTLSCLSVSPVVTASPFCSFTYPNNNPSIAVGSGTPVIVPMTITTFGPFPTTRLHGLRTFYAFWLIIPALGLMGVLRPGHRRKRFLGIFFLVSIAGSLLLLPACNSTNNTNSPSGLTTPKNTYTFTLTGADQNGAGPSNTTSGTGAATVSVTVN